MAKNNETETNSNNINLIGFGTEIHGDIKCNGDLRIDGVLFGNISAKGKIVIGETGKIKGEVTSKNADVSGFIDGKIIVNELLSLKSTARVVGDMTTSRLAIEPGSQFTGYCDMTNGSKKDSDTSSEISQTAK
ncbi:MAG: polymer-forming cytoskeletal protein [Tenuifilaceae bacterium]|jgi:cytoskeletal protein CcmA (bactofilin family)|nr:polymer-forming cytoskeletal protein [Bacteroidales bacterium]MDI9516316.1 polymer-forming cytoskeletal protein [Bacteroidota bacterium]NLH57280.1 polymer-forming cytoskeletal protein [Rikenellaceae bacterium]OQC61587.1 MAG: Polymer-forming cytoskeletal [Bacteroidetes bacterium ADurb.Bin008]HNV81458.1 polymer-forming cytoskeletal protein [Tenuifilaceae bacterium]